MEAPAVTAGGHLATPPDPEALHSLTAIKPARAGAYRNTFPSHPFCNGQYHPSQTANKIVIYKEDHDSCPGQKTPGACKSEFSREMGVQAFPVILQEARLPLPRMLFRGSRVSNAYIRISVHALLYVYIYMYVLVYLCIYMYMYMYLCIYVAVYKYVCICLFL